MKSGFLLFICLCLPFTISAQTLDTLVTIATAKLHFTIYHGKGTPIVFEAGNGDDSNVWRPILNEIHQKTGATLITYDRAGLGSSEIDTLTISFQKEIDNLNQALKVLSPFEDYFLVAHSFGGYYASAFANLENTKIKGGVFIDAATPCMFTESWSKAYRASLPKEAWDVLKQKRTGLYHVLQKLPEISRYMANRYIGPSIPVTVVAAEHIPGKNTLKTAQERTQWIQCLKEFGQGSNRKYVFAKGASHRVWKERPDLVIQEIVSLYKKTSPTLKGTKQ